MRKIAASVAVVCVWTQFLVALGPVSAQTNVETNAPGIQLNFSTPGARSLALGGTFLGRADDATAAYANPAGLANLPEREASLELRGWGFTHVFTDQGCGPAECGEVPFDQLVDGEASDEVLGASFASFVHPWRRWALAVYFHTLADFEANFSTQGAFLGKSSRGAQIFLRPVTSRSQLEIFSLGLAASYRVSPKLSLGVGLSRYDFAIDSTLERYGIDRRTFEPERGSPTDAQTQLGTDADLGATLGILWRASPRVQFGGVYRQGPSFGFEAQNIIFLASGDRIDPPKAANFNVPDQWGVGAMLQATERLILGVDFYQIGYSAFGRDFTDLFSAGAGDSQSFVADDGEELHFGVEYLFPNGVRPWWLRSGVWFDPAHGVRYTGEDLGFAAVFRERDGAWHWAAGGGMVGESYQIDLGLDLSERTTTISLSTVFRF